MWVLVLDRSASMGNPFSGNTNFAGRSKQSAAESKLEAARQAVIEHLAGLSATSRVVLIAFNNQAEVVYDGPSSDAAALRAALDAITAQGGTDLALALGRAAKAVRGAMRERMYRVLVITDGQTDADVSRIAAEDLARAGAIIDVTLIDPTDAGDAVARAIAIDGSVSAVTSASELQRGVGRAKAAQEAQREGVEAMVARQDQERAQLAVEKPRDERLAFTALYPPDIEPARWYPFTVYVHLAALRAEVERQIRMQTGDIAGTPFVSVANATRGIARGTWLTLTPRVAGLEFNPASATVAWHEDIQDVRFRFRALDGSADQSTFGQLDVAVGPLPIAHLGVTINLRTSPLAPAGKPEPQQTGVYQDVFASYSSKDRAIVHAFRETYWGLGIQLVVDKRTLRSGDTWDPALRALIERCDLFQLFWSKNASESEPVRQEYLHAIAQVPKKQPGFIRPLTWEERPPSAPEELARLHFAPIDLSQLSRLTGKPLRLDNAGTAPANAPAGNRFLPATAVPLLPGASPDTVQRVREDLGIAVRFLEETTGLRYYPVPTLLVDEHLVKAVRVVETIDLKPGDAESARRARDMLEFLSAVCLQVHVGGFVPGDENRREEFEERFSVDTVMSREQFVWLRGSCEVFPRLDDVLAPRWRVALHEVGESIGRPELDLSLTDFVTLILETAAEEVEKQPVGTLVASESYLGGRVQVGDDLLEVFRAANGVTRSENPLHLAGPPPAFAALIRELGRRLVPSLREVQGIDNSRLVSLSTPAELPALCKLAGFLVRELLPKERYLRARTQSFQLDDWIDELLSPRWMGMGEALTATGFATPGSLTSARDVVATFVQAVQRLFDAGIGKGDFDYKMSYSIPRDAWERLSPEFGNHGLQAHDASWSVDRSDISGQLSHFIECFRTTTQRLLPLLENPVQRRSGQQRMFVEISPTFGIFAPTRSEATDLALHRWATDMGVAQAITLPGSDRVLFCLAARERFEQGLRDSLPDAAEVQRVAAVFQQAVLVHEHFHAILEVGIDAKNSAAPGTQDADDWRDARNLNEALAAWMELHFARGDVALERLVWDYILAGRYPEWPYAGAESIERQYAAGGLETVRGWIGRLRQSPQSTQQEFDRAR